MQRFERLQALFEELPGIGPRQARRFIYALLRKDSRYSRELAEHIADIKSNMQLCEQTKSYFYSEDKSEKLSPIARDETRDHSRVMIIETDNDLRNIEQLGTWRGTYFVLGGTVPVQSDNPERYIRLKDLVHVLKEKIDTDRLNEVVLGTSASPEGDHTAEVVEDELHKLQKSYSFSITHLGRGLSTGTALEYVDNETLRNALESRR